MDAKQRSLEDLADAISRAAPDFDAAQERVALTVYQLLAGGRPVPASGVAQAADVPVELVKDLLDRWPGVFRDDEGRVIGFWGLAIEELTPTHRFELDDRPLYAWCAWDTLFLPGILGRTARVTSTCPTTGERIELRVGPKGVFETSHPGAVVSFLVPEGSFDADVVQSFCHYVHFFADREAGDRWLAEHEGTFLPSLDQAFEHGRLTNARNFPHALGGDG